MKPPTFTSQAEADEWLERTDKLLHQAMRAGRQLWLAEDDTIIGYNTFSAPDGGFYSFRYRPEPGGYPAEVIFVKRHARRKVARVRAVALYRKYSPKWAAKGEELHDGG